MTEDPSYLYYSLDRPGPEPQLPAEDPLVTLRRRRAIEMLPIEPTSRLGSAIDAAQTGILNAADKGKAAMEYSLGGPERARSWLLDPQVPRPAIDVVPAAPVRSESEQMPDLSGVVSGASKGVPVPSITQDAQGHLVSSGAVPRLHGGAIPESVRAGEFQFREDPFTDSGGPDVSLAGMERNARARAAIEANYQQRQQAIEHPGDLGRAGQTEALNLTDLGTRVAARAADPFELRAYGARKAIDVGSEIQKQNEMLSGIRATLQQIDDDATKAAAQVKASALPDLKKKELLDSIAARADQAKREFQQSVGFATGKVPSSLYQENAFGTPR